MSDFWWIQVCRWQGGLIVDEFAPHPALKWRPIREAPKRLHEFFEIAEHDNFRLPPPWGKSFTTLEEHPALISWVRFNHSRRLFFDTGGGLNPS